MYHLYYSKYDHYGILYFEMTKRSKEEKDKTIQSAIEHLVLQLFLILVILLKFESQNKELLDTKSIGKLY